MKPAGLALALLLAPLAAADPKCFSPSREGHCIVVEVNGQTFIDSVVLADAGATDLSGYGGGDDPILDIFVDEGRDILDHADGVLAKLCLRHTATAIHVRPNGRTREHLHRAERGPRRCPYRKEDALTVFCVLRHYRLPRRPLHVL